MDRTAKSLPTETSPTLQEILTKLGARQAGTGWEASCPAHEDRRPSLSIGVGEDGRILLHCHRGCQVLTIVEALGLSMADLRPVSNDKPRKRIVKTYDYRNESGALLYQVCRMEPKGFYQRRPAEGGGWVKSIKDVRRVLYGLRELLAASVGEPVFVVEGEKDVECLRRLGFIATTNAGGAGKWRGEYSEALRDRHVVILPDNDDPGRDHGQHVAASLAGIARSVKIIELPGLPAKGDVSDWIAAGGTKEQLTALVAETQCSTPGPERLNQDTETPAVTDDPHVDGEKASRKSQATILVELAADAELWRTPSGDPYVTVPVLAHRENWPVRSRDFRRWLAHRFFTEFRAAPGSQAIADAITAIEGKAIFEGSTHESHVRVAHQDDAAYIDLCNETWQAKAMLPLPTPVQDGSLAPLRGFVNVSDADWPLVLGWLVGAYSRGPFPVLGLHAEQGSGKTTAARVLRAIVDPNTAPVRSEPRDPRDLMIAASNGWVIVMDNLSHVPGWMSDALCRISTGGGFSTRTLYENDEETIFEAMRPIVLTGIEEVITRGDLLDRSILISLEPIAANHRLPEREFWKLFDAMKPSIFGALLTAVSTALRNFDNAPVHELPRMADFALWATAAEPAMGLATSDFMDAYARNRSGANDLAIECTPIGMAVLDLMKTTSYWQGTATELLAEVESIVGDKTRNLRGWPRTARAMSGAMKRLAPNLRMAGVDVQQERSAKRRTITLARIGTESSVTNVTTVTEPENPGTSLTDDDAKAPADDATVTQDASKNDADDGDDDDIPF